MTGQNNLRPQMRRRNSDFQDHKVELHHGGKTDSVVAVARVYLQCGQQLLSQQRIQFCSFLTLKKVNASIIA